MLYRRLVLAALALVLLAACSSREDSGGRHDAAPGDTDGGVTDAGSADAGPRADAGSTADAGPTDDAGTTEDAGPADDGGTVTDAGTDAGPAPVDAGPGGCTRGTCPTGEYCATPVGECDGVGTCTTIPTDVFCTTLYDPVCGCDGSTYGNSCNAHVAGVAVDHEGECGSTS